jgi:hypothetical protein
MRGESGTVAASFAGMVKPCCSLPLLPLFFLCCSVLLVSASLLPQHREPASSASLSLQEVVDLLAKGHAAKCHFPHHSLVSS